MLGQGSRSPKLGSLSRFGSLLRWLNVHVASPIGLLPPSLYGTALDCPRMATPQRPKSERPASVARASALLSAGGPGSARTVNGREPTLWQIESMRRGLQIVESVMFAGAGKFAPA